MPRAKFESWALRDQPLPECAFYIWPSLDQNVQTKTDKYGRHEPMTITVQ
jgi:hypothetical protein